MSYKTAIYYTVFLLLTGMSILFLLLIFNFMNKGSIALLMHAQCRYKHAGAGHARCGQDDLEWK